MSFYNQLRRLNESSILLEYNRKDLRNFAGDEYAAKFFNLRDKLQAPENDLGHWIKKGDVAAFKKFIDDWESGATKSKTQKKKEERIAGAELVFDDKGWKVYHITTYDAAKQLGSGTTWCITGRYRGYESRGKEFFNNYIRDYHLDGGYYFFFDTLNKDPNTGDYLKYCMGINKNNRIAFFYNGMQDQEISNKGIPDMPEERRIQPFKDKGITVPYYDRFVIEDNIVMDLKDASGLAYETIVVPEGVVGIYRYVFRDTKLTSIKLPSTLKEIGIGAFAGCHGLDNIDIPDSVEVIGKGCFMDSGIKQIALKNVNVIPSRAFAYCDQLKKVELSVQTTSIAEDAFDDCSNGRQGLHLYSKSLEPNKAIIDFANNNNFIYLSSETEEIFNGALFKNKQSEVR